MIVLDTILLPLCLASSVAHLQGRLLLPQGVFLRKNVIAVAGRSLKANLTSLGMRVLPYSELVSPR